MTTWINNWLGTCAWDRLGTPPEGTTVIDVRDMVDKTGNSKEHIQEKIRCVLAGKSNTPRVIVCCDYGMSRSNAIALGALCAYSQISASEALACLLEKIPETHIKLETLHAVYDAIQPAGQSDVDPQRILITGANGFIGRHLTSRLSTKAHLLAPSRDQIDLAKNPLMLHAYARDHRVGRIVHLANPRVFTHNSVVSDSLLYLKNILDVVRHHPAKLVYLSGWEVYSGHVGELHADEQTPANPRGSYGESKWLCELLLEQHRKLYEIDYLTLRASPVYGTGSEKPKFLYHFIEKAIRHQDIQTHCYLNSDPGLDLLHIDDFIDAIETAIEQDLSGTYNLGTGQAVTTPEIADHIIQLTNSRSSISRVMINATTAIVRMNSTRFEHETGWRAKKQWAQGIEQIVNGMCSHE